MRLISNLIPVKGSGGALRAVINDKCDLFVTFVTSDIRPCRIVFALLSYPSVCLLAFFPSKQQKGKNILPFWLQLLCFMYCFVFSKNIGSVVILLTSNRMWIIWGHGASVSWYFITLLFCSIYFICYHKSLTFFCHCNASSPVKI